MNLTSEVDQSLAGRVGGIKSGGEMLPTTPGAVEWSVTRVLSPTQRKLMLGASIMVCVQAPPVNVYESPLSPCFECLFLDREEVNYSVLHEISARTQRRQLLRSLCAKGRRFPFLPELVRQHLTNCLIQK